MRGLLEEQSVAHSYGAVDGPTFKDDDAFGMDVALHARSSLDFNTFRYDDGADNAAAEYGVGRVDVAMNDARFPKQELLRAAHRSVNGPIDLDHAVAFDVTDYAHAGADDGHAGFSVSRV